MRIVIISLFFLLAPVSLMAQPVIDAYFTRKSPNDEPSRFLVVDLVMKNSSADTQRVEWFMASLGPGSVDPRIWIDDRAFYFSGMSQGSFPEATSYIVLPPDDSVFATFHIDKRYSSTIVSDTIKFTFGTTTFITPDGANGAHQKTYHEFTTTFTGITPDRVYAVQFNYLRENSAIVDSIYSLVDLELKSQKKFPLRQEDIVDVFYPPKDSLIKFLSTYNHILTFNDSRALFRFYDESFVEFSPLNLDFVITDIEEEKLNLVSSISIDKLYPNPFNPTTTLDYSLSQSGVVQLNIYSIQGQNVLSFPAKRMNSGKYSQQINLSHLTSGTYIIKLQLEDVVLSRKIQLVK